MKRVCLFSLLKRRKISWWRSFSPDSNFFLKTTLHSLKKWNVSVECFLRIKSRRHYCWSKSKFCRAHMRAEQESKASKWLSYCFNTSALPLSMPPYPTSHTVAHPSLRPGSCGSLRSFCWVLLSAAASLRSHASQVTELRFLCAADVWFPDTDANVLLSSSSWRMLLLIRTVMQLSNRKLQCGCSDHRTITKNK